MTPNSSKQPSNKAVAAVCFLLFGLGFVASCAFIRSFLVEPTLKQKEALHWREVACTIREISVESVSIPAGRKSTTGSTGYKPKVQFDYVIEGKTYSSDTFWFSSILCDSRAEAAEAIAPFERSENAVCFVNPKNPAEAVLVRDASNPVGVKIILPIAFCIVFGIAMIGLPWAILRSKD